MTSTYLEISLLKLVLADYLQVLELHLFAILQMWKTLIWHSLLWNDRGYSNPGVAPAVITKRPSLFSFLLLAEEEKQEMWHPASRLKLQEASGSVSVPLFWEEWMKERECKRREEGYPSQAGIIVTSVLVSSTMWQAADQPKPFDSLALARTFFFLFFQI